MELGFTKEEFIKITSLLPSIICLSQETILNKINLLKSFSLSDIQIKNMILAFPGILTYSIENVSEKIKFYGIINILDKVYSNPMLLMQSIALSNARIGFFKSRNINIDNSNSKWLFYSNKAFTQKFGINNEELLELYGKKNNLEESDERTT